ncbi:hypothetical protein ABPG72_007026 [Tetrahymena utriculariae]
MMKIYNNFSRKLHTAVNFYFSDELPCSKRRWLNLGQEENTSSPQKKELRIMQYNVLAPCYTYPNLYPDCTKQDLEWHARLDLLIKEIKFVDPTILCLQETQLDTLYDLNDKLKEVFDVSIIHSIKGKSKKDGCTTIFKKEEYEEIYSVKLDLDQSSSIYSELKWINCENICLFTLLKDKKKPNSFILMGNTHFIYSPQMGLVKLGQAKLITSAIKSILETEGDKSIDVFLCGDFNFIPNSALYSFFTQQSINFESLPLHEVSNQDIAYTFEKNENSIDLHFQSTTRRYQFFNNNKTQKEYIPYFESLTGLEVKFDKTNQEFNVIFNKNENLKNKNIITSDICLKSAYAEMYKQYNQKFPNSKKSLINNLISKISKQDNLTYEYGLSHFTKKGYLQCDFIWYKFADPASQKHLKQILQQHDYSYVNKFKAFPNQYHPSDHFPIVASFELNEQ